MVGGYLGATGDYYYGAKLAVAGSLLSVVLTLFLPNNNNIKINTTNLDEKNSIENDISKEKIDVVPSTLFVIQTVWLFLSIKVISSVANAMSGATMPLILKNTYGLNEQSLGNIDYIYIYTYILHIVYI